MTDSSSRRWWLTPALIATLLSALALMLALAGFDVTRAGAALLSGAFGSWYAFASGTLVRATPLILTGLAVSIAFRAGVFNIGAEGQFLVGAAAAAAVGLTAPSPIAGTVVILAAGSLAGAAWSGIAATLRARYRVLEVISTIMLNFVAIYVVSYLVRGPLQEPLHIYPQTAMLPSQAQLARLGSATRLHTGFLMSIAACIVAWWTIRFTYLGFRLRAVGANPEAARIAGQINVPRVTTGAFLVSGALAGLAGAIEVSGVTYALYENISPGYGYTAIVIALLARNNPAGVLVAGIVFGALDAGAAAMQRDAGVPSVVVSIIEAVIILALIALGRVRIRPQSVAV